MPLQIVKKSINTYTASQLFTALVHWYNWSVTAGDRYVIKLFKDFVFHQVNESGGPLVDWGHVIEALNKLDLGLPEKVMLLSRDEMSMLLVSYADVKQCIDTAYKELEAGAGRRHM